MFLRQPKNTLAIKTKILESLVRHVAAPQFLAEEKRGLLLKKIKQLMQLDAARYDNLCAGLKENLVNYAQNLPETSNSYYSSPGGLIDFSLNRAEAALSLFKEFMIYDENDGPSEIQKLWQYTLYSAAILQGIGKLFTDYNIHLYDGNGTLLAPWNPLLESLNSNGSYYNYEYKKEAGSEFKCRLNLLLAKALMPANGFAWIASNEEILTIWLALLDEDYRGAGTLGAILIRAEAKAIQRYVLEYRAGKMAVQGKHFGGIGTFSGGGSPDALNLKKQAMGIAFIEWVVKALGSEIIMINKAPLLMVPGGMLMCKEMFDLFCRHDSRYKNALAVKEGVLLLGLHSTGPDGSEEQRFEQKHTHDIQNGIVFKNYAIFLPDTVKVELNNRVEVISALKLINSQLDGQFVAQKKSEAICELKKLPPSGQWQDAAAFLSPGVKKGG